MSSQFKNRLMVGTIIIAVLLAMGWSYEQLTDSRAAEFSARQDLADCRQMVDQIQSLRQRPAVAGTTALGAADLSRRIENAAGIANFADGCIVRIDPEPARRLGETNYLEMPTLLELRHVTLQQTFTFLHSLSGELAVHDIRLTAPRGEETGDRWTVETTLTYTVYSPKVPEDSAAAPSVAAAEK
jgi:hypothetical protein